MIIFCTSYIGNIKSENMHSRLKNLRLIHRMISEILIMLNCSLFTVPEIIAGLKINEQFKEFDFLDTNVKSVTVKEDICNNIDKTEHLKGLTDDDKERLKYFWRNLGSTEIQGQVSLADMYSNELLSGIKDLEMQYKQKGKLYRALGILIGTFIAVMLI